MIGTILVSVVAAIHVYIAWLEMAQWEAPRTRRIFGMSETPARYLYGLGASPRRG